MSKLAWYPTDQCFIGGRWVAPLSGETLPLEDPSRGATIGVIARGTAGDVDAAVEAAERALAGDWGKLTATERGRLMMKLSELVKMRVEELARIEALDVGKPLEAGPGGCAGDGPLHGVLRRRGRQGFRRDHSLSRRLHRLHLARAAWRDRPYRAVELSDADRRPHDRRGAGDGQRLRA